MNQNVKPPSKHEAVTTSDTVNLGLSVVRFIYVGGAGNVAIEDQKGNQVTYNSVPAGTFIPIQAAKVLSTGTTATNMVASGD